MARGNVSLDDKIKKAETKVIAIKAKYDEALDELEKLVEKRKQIDDKKLLEAYHNGGKTADEIIAFILAGEDKPEVEEKPRRRRKRL